MASMEEDEWEYEYDQTETEDFYITADLSNVPGRGNSYARPGAIRPSLSGHPILLRSRLRALNAVRRYEDTVADASSSEELSSLGTMQITGLHTEKPLIMYNDQLLSCTWAATIGTDIFFVKPNPGAASEDQPLRSLPSVHLLATSSAKLMASVARMRPGDHVLEDVPLHEVHAATQLDSSEDARRSNQQSAVVAPRVAQNGFLARLNEAKAKRGDKSRLKVSNASNGVRLVATSWGEPAGHGRPTVDTIMGGTHE